LILADTDVLIDYLTGVQPAENQVRKYIEADALQTSAVTCFELLCGAREGRRGDKTRDFVASIPALPLDRESAALAAAVRQRLESIGSAIGMADSLIAGIALANDLPLLTRNRKHFQAVEGLRLLPLG